MVQRVRQLVSLRLLLFAVSLAVCLVAGTASLFHAEGALHTERLLIDSVENGRNAAELHEALRQTHLAAVAWLDSGGRPDLRKALQRRRDEVAAALQRTVIADRAPRLLAELDDALGDAEAALGHQDVHLLADRIDGTLESAAMALEGAMSQATVEHVRQAHALRQQHVRGLWITGAFAALALALATWLTFLWLRSSAQREGATAMRNELLERTSDGFCALDREFRIVHLNSAAERLLDRSLREVHGQTLFEAWPSLKQHPLGEQFRRAMVATEVLSDEVFSRRASRWYQVRFYPSPEGVSTFFRDVTEERQMRLALAESEARHRQIVQTAQEGIWILDRDGKTAFVNEKLCELLGYPREEILGRHLFDFMDAEGQRIAAENLQRRGLGLREQQDFKFRRQDGTTVWALLATSALSEADDGSTLAMLTDITERRRAESERGLLLSRERSLRAAAEASNDRYRVLANLVPHVVWTHRGDGSVDFVNQTYSERTGQPLDQALGSGWQAMIHPEDLPGYVEAWKSSLLSGEAFERRVRLRGADGSWHWHLNRAQPARDAEGRLVRWFGLAVELAA